MGEEKSAWYTIVLGVCLLLCLLMLGRMLVGRSENETPPGGVEPVETLPEEEQQQEPQPSLVMTMNVDKAELEESGLLTGHFRAAAQVLPEKCSLAGKWGAEANQGKLSFTCRSAQLNGTDLPQTAADLVTAAMSDALNRKLEELNIAPKRLAWSDGEIEIYA